jgi:hypothetical protein
MREELLRALRCNSRDRAAIRMSPKDTTFEGLIMDEDDLLAEDEAVILAVKSVPCHY